MIKLPDLFIRRCCDETWVRWRLDSLATQLFVQQHTEANKQIQYQISASVSTGDRRIPFTRGQ